MALTKTLYPDNEKLLLGTDGDLELYSDDTDSYLSHTKGDLYIYGVGSSDDIYIWSKDDIYLSPQNGESGIKVIGNGAVELYWDNLLRLSTKENGVQLRGGSTNKEHWCEGHYFPWTNATYDIGGTAASDGSVYYWRDGLFSRNLILRGDSGEFRVEAANGVDAFTVDSDNGNTYIGGQTKIGTTTEGNASADNLTVADSAACGITIRSGDTNTGNIYFSDATTGSGEFAGAVEYKHGSGGDEDSLRFHTNSNERMRIDKNGHVGIGTDDPFAPTNYKGLELSGTTGGCITFSDDEVQKWEIYGQDEELSFYNRTNTAWRLRLLKAGNVEISDGDLVVANGHGIDFSNQTWTSATGANTTHELLDHYEEGTWTPVFESYESGAWGNAGFSTTGNQTAYFTRIGRLVVATMWRTGFQTDTSDTAYTRIKGLPYAVYDSSGAGSVGYMNNAFANNEIRLFTGASGIEIYKNDGNWNSWSDSNNSNIYFTVQYIVQ